MNNHLTKAISDVTDLVNKLAGPLAEEVGQLLGDKAREYRIRNLIKISHRVQQMLQAADVVPFAIPPRLFLPALEAASIENNDVLQERWAALIANAASPTGPDTVLPSFVEILKQLTPEEAVFLSQIRERARTPFRLGTIFPGGHPEPADRGRLLGGFNVLRTIYVTGKQSGSPENSRKLSLIVNDLVRLGILDRMPWYPTEEPTRHWASPNLRGLGESHSPGESDYFLTPFGADFIDACQAPAFRNKS